MRPPIAYYGSKATIARQIVALLPDHEHYVEPYCGSLAVLLAKPRSRMETVNDIDRELMTWWRVLRDRPDDLERVCALTPHSRAELDESWHTDGHDDLEVARRVWVQLTQGRGGRRTSTGWRNRAVVVTSPIPDHLHAYAARIPPAAGRLYGVSLECRPAFDVIKTYGAGEQTLLYVDPPYAGETGRSVAYRHEMADAAAHHELAEALRACRAAVVLSGYPSPLYDDELYPDWHRHEIPTQTRQGGHGSPRTEVLWSNRALGLHPTLFDVPAVTP